MSPTALNARGHHDSFSLPAQDQSQIHPSARRAPEGGLIKVESDSTVYEADGIKAKFTDRGASVIKGPDGKLSVKKTEKNFEFFTKTKVGRVGWVNIAVYPFSTSDNLQSYARRSRR